LPSAVGLEDDVFESEDEVEVEEEPAELGGRWCLYGGPPEAAERSFSDRRLAPSTSATALLSSLLLLLPPAAVVVVKGKTNAPSAGEALGVGVLEPGALFRPPPLLLAPNGLGPPSPAAGVDVEFDDDGLELGREPAFLCCDWWWWLDASEARSTASLRSATSERELPPPAGP
jgi:hypothetical protein